MARFAGAAKASAVARLPDDRRLATLIACIRTLEATAQDDVLDLFDIVVPQVFADALKAVREARMLGLHDLVAAALTLRHLRKGDGSAALLPGNASVRFETAAYATAALSRTALDKLDEPASLMALRAAAAARMPGVDLPETLLEMHARTGFASEFTHAGERGARAGDLATSICAVLLAEACDTGLEPLISLGALLRSQLCRVS